MTKSLKDVQHFIKFAADKLGIDQVPNIKFLAHEHDKKHSFGAYTPKDNHIVVRTLDRHPLDVMRTIAHELVHHKWKLEGKKADRTTGSASENDANAKAGEIMRDYDDEHPNVFKDKPIQESDGLGPSPVNSMGSSSSSPMTGGIDTFDPLLNPKKKLRNIVKRKTLEDLKK